MDEEREEPLEDGMVEFVDDFGNTVKFKLVGVTEYKGEKYAVLLPAEPAEGFAEDEVGVFRFNEKERILETIEDEALLEEVFEHFCNEEDEEDGDGLPEN